MPVPLTNVGDMSSIPALEETVSWLTPTEEETWHNFMLMTAQLNAVMNKDLQLNAGLSGADYGVLVALAERESHAMRIFELCRELGWEKSRLSHHLARMTQRKLVEKMLCPQDARGAIIALTEEGWDALRNAAPRHVATVRDYFIDLVSKEQLDVLAKITAKVLAKLESAPED